MRVPHVIVAASWAIVALVLLATGLQFGMLISIPVMATAWVYGLRGAILAGLLALPWSLLFTWLGGLSLSSATTDPSVFVGHALTGGLGLLLGYSSTLRTRLEQTTRARVHAEMEARMLRADRLATVGTLAAGVAHEVNNPLTYLLGNLELLKADLERSRGDGRIEWEQLQAAIDDAVEGGQRIEKIMRELKLFVREPSEELGEVDLEQVVETSVKLTRHELKPGTQLVRKLDSVPKVRGDAGKLAQVFVNLIVNAAHAIPDTRKRGRIEVELGHDGAEVTVNVSDDGIGMSEEVRRRVFEPFFTTKPVGIGTGLGLAVCASIVRQHGGTLELDTTLGQGTKFRLRIPIAEPALPLRAP